jgi:hypothetical protein
MVDEPGVYLTTSSERFAWFMVLRADAQHEIVQLPDDFRRKVIALAQTPEGGPRIAASQSGIIVRSPLSGTQEVVADSAATIVNFEMDELGTLHSWYVPFPPDDYVHAYQAADGDWLSERAVSPGDSGWELATATSSGAQVTFDTSTSSTADEHYFLADEGQGAYALSGPMQAPPERLRVGRSVERCAGRSARATAAAGRWVPLLAVRAVG